MAVLDWKEHMDHEAISHKTDKVLSITAGGMELRSWKKSLGIVQGIWTSIIEQNIFDRPADEDSLVNIEALEDTDSSSDEETDILNLFFRPTLC